MKKKLLIVANNISGGGAEKVFHTLMDNLNSSKYDITVYVVHEPDSLAGWPETIKFKSIFRHRISKNTFLNTLLCKFINKIKLLIYNQFSPRVFYRLNIRGKYDTEIAFIEGYATRIVSGSNNSKSKKIAWCHIDFLVNHWSLISYRYKAEETKAYSCFNSVMAVSENVKKSIDTMFGIQDRSKVIHNPIDSDFIIKSSEKELPEIPKQSRVRFLKVGRLVDQKGDERRITNIEKNRDEGYDTELWIIGDGGDKAKLARLIEEYNLKEEVILHGFQSNPYSFFKYCDAFVCSSRSEGYSTAVTEALILGMPVVTTNCSGMDELLGADSQYGIITANNENALKNGMIKITNPEILNHYKQKALERGSQFCLKSLMYDIEREL